MSSRSIARTDAEVAVEALLEGLAARFSPTSLSGRQLFAARATLKRKGLAAFLLETQEVLDSWRRQAQTLQEFKAVALQRYILLKSCAALGVQGVGELTLVAGSALALGVCELCEGELDALQWCFGCHKRLCAPCNKSRSCYPMCPACVLVWTPRRVQALFSACLSLPREERDEARWRQLQRQLVEEDGGSFEDDQGRGSVPS